MDWAIESTDIIEKDLSYFTSIHFTRSNKYSKLRAYSESLRSFVIAHPLETTRHKKFKLDGSFICVDIQPQGNDFLINNNYKYFSLSGLHSNPNEHKRYVYIKCQSANKILTNSKSKTIKIDYNKSPNILFYFGIALEDIYNVISYCIKRLEYFNNELKGLI